MSDTEKTNLTEKGNTVIDEVWITHHDTAYGPYIDGVSLKPWGADYDAPITTWADNVRFVRADTIAALRAEVERLTVLASERLALARQEGVSRVEQFERAEAAAAEVARLTAECFALAAWQCPFTDGKTGLTSDEYGNQFCAMKARADAAFAAGVEAAAKVVDDVRRSPATAGLGCDVIIDAIRALAAPAKGESEVAAAFQASCEGVAKAFQAAALNISDVDDRGRRHFLPGVVLDELNGAGDQLRPGVQYRVDGMTITFRYVPKTGEPLVASMIEEIDGSPPKGGDPIPPQLALLLRPARNIEQED